MEAETLGQILTLAAAEHGPSAALRHRVDGRYQTITYDGLRDSVRRLATELLESGIAPGDRVALLASNRPEWAIADLATLSIGAAVVPLYPTLTSSQIGYILANSAARTLFVANRIQLDKILEVRDQLPALERIIAFDDRDLPDGIDRLGSILAARPAAADDAVDARLDACRPDDLASIVYTSGTTGDPKGVRLSHRNLVSNALSAARLFEFGPGDVSLSFLPLSHIFERTCGYYAMLAAGVTIAYAESIDTVSRDLLEVRPTVMLSVPRLYEKLYDRIVASVDKGPFLRRRLFRWAVGVGRRAAERRERKEPVTGLLGLSHGLADRLVFSSVRQRTGGRLKYSFSGGAPLEPGIARFFHAVGLLVLEGYGQTESSPIISTNTPEAYRVGTVGRPLPEVEVRLAEEDGEILARGPNIMAGYHENPEATAATLTADGWLHTGDIGELDADGFLRITDRKKDLFKTSGGKYVAPSQIENLLKVEPLVSQAVAIGERRKYVAVLLAPDFDQLEIAAREAGVDASDREALVADPEIRRMYQAILDRLAASGQLARFETPKRFALLPRELSQDEGELTPTQKIRREVVDERYRDLIESLYA